MSVVRFLAEILATFGEPSFAAVVPGGCKLFQEGLGYSQHVMSLL